MRPQKILTLSTRDRSRRLLNKHKSRPALFTFLLTFSVLFTTYGSASSYLPHRSCWTSRVTGRP